MAWRVGRSWSERRCRGNDDGCERNAEDDAPGDLCWIDHVRTATGGSMRVHLLFPCKATAAGLPTLVAKRPDVFLSEFWRLPSRVGENPREESGLPAHAAFMGGMLFAFSL